MARLNIINFFFTHPANAQPLQYPTTSEEPIFTPEELPSPLPPKEPLSAPEEPVGSGSDSCSFYSRASDSITEYVPPSVCMSVRPSVSLSVRPSVSPL